MTTLCIDFGNTRQKAVLFTDDKISEEFYFSDGTSQNIQMILDQHHPERSILSSVIHHDEAIEELLSASTSFHKLTSSSILNFKIGVGKKETIGADRLALMAAAAHFCPAQNILVIGMGSCITYNFINQFNTFLGGSISPGMQMRFKSMHEHTAKLPLAEASFNIPLVGYDTVTNLQSGVIHGIAAEIDGIITNYVEKYGNFNAVLTGGNSTYFAGRVKNRIFADLNFLFKGLYALSEINYPK